VLLWFWNSTRLVIASNEANSKASRTWDAWLKGSIVFAMGAFLMTLGLSGCGGSGPEDHSFTPEQAKASAKYRELHPEEFPVVKKKTVKARRGG
jgi:hypothetical protein